MNQKRIGIFACAFLILLLKALLSNGQQDPMYSQYMFNIQSFNPAYAGSWENLGVTLLAREQWLGFDNNPRTQTVTIQAPFRNDKVGIGFSLINDKLGVESRMAVFADYSYGIKVNQNTTLRLGIKGGFTNYNNNLSDYVLIDQDDPTFQGDLFDVVLPNFGVGAFLYSKKYYAGFSAPKILQNEIGDYTNKIEMRYFSFIGGIVFGVCNGIDIKPSINVRYHSDDPIVADFNISFLFVDKFWIGAMFRTSDDLEIGFNTNFLISDKLRIGYAYDLLRSSGLSSYTSGTHEIMISYEFRFKKTYYTSPRYF